MAIQGLDMSFEPRGAARLLKSGLADMVDRFGGGGQDDSGLPLGLRCECAICILLPTTAVSGERNKVQGAATAPLALEKQNSVTGQLHAC